MRSAVPFALVVLALVAAGCGNDEVAKKPKSHTRTERTEPRTETEPATTAPQAAPQVPSSTAQDPATAPAPQGEGNGTTGGTPQGGTDSPQNDTAPPKGSPAERFEQQCRSRPKACG